jgi:hypothetical protein
MSQINDALKRARQVPPNESPPLSPLPPVAETPPPSGAWLVPTAVVILLVAAIFFIGWAVTHRSVRNLAAPPAPAVAAAPAPPAPVVAATLPTAPPLPPPTVVSPTAAPPELPKLEGIFYSPTAPSAIVDGTTVRRGDVFKQYRVREITRSAMILTDTNGQPVKLIIGN